MHQAAQIGDRGVASHLRKAIAAFTYAPTGTRPQTNRHRSASYGPTSSSVFAGAAITIVWAEYTERPPMRQSPSGVELVLHFRTYLGTVQQCFSVEQLHCNWNDSDRRRKASGSGQTYRVPLQSSGLNHSPESRKRAVYWYEALPGCLCR